MTSFPNLFAPLRLGPTKIKNRIFSPAHGTTLGTHDGLVSDDMIRKGLTLHGVWHWNLPDAPQMMQLIRESGDKLAKQITHTFPMSQVREAWELQLTGNCGKIILKPWE